MLSEDADIFISFLENLKSKTYVTVQFHITLAVSGKCFEVAYRIRSCRDGPNVYTTTAMEISATFTFYLDNTKR